MMTETMTETAARATASAAANAAANATATGSLVSGTQACQRSAEALRTGPAALRPRPGSRPSTIAVFVALLSVVPCGDATAGPLAKIRRESRTKIYKPSSARENAVAERIFTHLFQAVTNLERVRPLCSELQLDLTVLSAGDEKIVVVHEQPQHRRGRGVYAFRRRRFALVAWQSPHAYSDLYTGKITEQCFLEGRALAAAWNNAPRSAKATGSTDTADLAHVDDGLFHAFTRAFVKLYRTGIIYQLHGFSEQKRSTARGRRADVILSNGTATPPEWLIQLNDCMRESMQLKAALFPRDVRELGATTNVQGKICRALDHKGFVHIEFDLAARKRLRSDPRVRAELRSCLPEKQP